MPEQRVLKNGIRSLHDRLVDGKDCLDIPRASGGGPKILRQSFLQGLLSNELQLQRSLAGDVSAAQSDLRHLSLEQLLAIRIRTLDFATESRSHDAHNGFLATIDKLLFELVARRFLEQEGQASPKGSGGRHRLGYKVTLVLGAVALLTGSATDGDGDNAAVWAKPGELPGCWALPLDEDLSGACGLLARTALFLPTTLAIRLPLTSSGGTAPAAGCKAGSTTELTAAAVAAAGPGGTVAVIWDRSHGSGKDRMLDWDISPVDAASEDLANELARAARGSGLGAAAADELRQQLADVLGRRGTVDGLAQEVEEASGKRADERLGSALPARERKPPMRRVTSMPESGTGPQHFFICEKAAAKAMIRSPTILEEDWKEGSVEETCTSPSAVAPGAPKASAMPPVPVAPAVVPRAGSAEGLVPSTVIRRITARDIYDSSGRTALEVELFTDMGVVRASAPASRTSASSTSFAASEVNDRIGPALVGMDTTDQQAADATIAEACGAPFFVVSLAVCRAGAVANGMALYEYMAKLAGRPTDKFHLPMPAFHLLRINGECVEDLAVLPDGADSFRKALEIGAEVYHALKAEVKHQYGQDAINVIEDGAFNPRMKDKSEAFSLLAAAVNIAGHTAQVKLSCDLADAEGEQEVLDVCDDPGVLVLRFAALNSVTEAVTAAATAREKGLELVVVARGGATGDDFAAELALGLGARRLEAGAPCRSEHVAQYNQLLRIEEELGPEAGGFAGGRGARAQRC